jgi:hypothetical protein
MQTRRLLVPIVALPVFGVVALVGALSLHDPPKGAEVEASGIATPANLTVAVADETLVSPLDFFADGSGFTKEAADRLEAQVQSCMADRGWKYSPNPGLLALSEPVTVGALRSYRASSGYGIADKALVGRPADPNQALVMSLNEPDRARWNRDLSGGDSEGIVTSGPLGCRTEALHGLLTSTRMANPQVRAKVTQARQQIAENSEVLAAVDAWRSCMADKGFPGLANLRAPRNTLTSTGTASSELPSLKEKELRMATADFACQEMTVLPVLQRLEMEAVAVLTRELPGS